MTNPFNPNQLLVFFSLVMLVSCNQKSIDFYSIPKIDAHAHIYVKSPRIDEIAQENNFKFISITYESKNQKIIDSQLEFEHYQKVNFPETIEYTTAFSMEGFNKPDWGTKTIQRLHHDFDKGAIGVKVWKDIGMSFKNKNGDFINIDNPKFDPVLNFIESQRKTLVAHIAEPKNCWLPLDEMTVNNDKSYFKKHPEYHMYLHPEDPRHEELIYHRDQMLQKHPDLLVVGCHLGSLEWDVDELAKRFDRFPNFAVDMAARFCHFQVQDREKVRTFILKYQDRLIYGTDNEISEDNNLDDTLLGFQKTWLSHWDYFATDKTLTSAQVDHKFKGLALPESVLRKIYYKNAIKWFPALTKTKQL